MYPHFYKARNELLEVKPPIKILVKSSKSLSEPLKFFQDSITDVLKQQIYSVELFR